MSRYFREADPEGIGREYPTGDAFLERVACMSRDELHALQTARFRDLVAAAWDVPFYRRRWTDAGLAPGDIRTLDDLSLIPPFSKDDLMASVEACPPFGDFRGRAGQRIVMHTTSGTTGTPQPLFYGPRDREIQNLLLARAYLLQGMRADDVVHSVYGFGMVNGGHYVREAILHYTDALLLPAGTGLETRSEQQVGLMQRYGATVLVGFADYMLKLAATARELGLEPGRDIPLRMISGHLADDGGESLTAAWGGAVTYDWYGVGDTGIIAAEGPDRDGLHIWEDAHIVEILDSDTGRAVPDGTRGTICVTVLFKQDVYPIIRFDTKDVSTMLPGTGAAGYSLRRLAGFQGRSDNMVKLRGINVYPTAVGGHLREIEALGGEYFCRVSRRDGRDEMTVVCETRADAAGGHALERTVADHLRQRLGVTVAVMLVGPGETAGETEVNSRQKPIRLRDDR